MTNSSTQTGTVVITVASGQGTTLNLPPAMLHHGAGRRVLRQVHGDAVDGDELHHHRLVVGVVDQLQIVAEAAGAGADPPDFAVRRGDRDGGILLPADGEVPRAAGEIVAAVRHCCPGPGTSRGAPRRAAGIGCRIPDPPGSAPRRRRPAAGRCRSARCRRPATWMSLSIMWRTLASGNGALLASPVTLSPTLPMVMRPDMALDTWLSAMPCTCGWNQSRPDGWLVGTGIL